MYNTETQNFPSTYVHLVVIFLILNINEKNLSYKIMS